MPNSNLRLFWLTVGIELAGIFLVGIGIGYEVAYQADIGFVAITLGACLIAAGGAMHAKIRPWIKKDLE